MRKTPLIGKCRFKSVRMVKGLKDWECCECDRLIPKRTEHQYVNGMWGFSKLEFRTCLDCVDRWDDLKANNPNFDFAPFMNGDLEEAIAYLETAQMAC